MTSGAHTSGNEENPVTEVISIKFRGRGKTYYFDPAGVTARTGDTLVVETSKGMELGECVKGNHTVGDGDCVQPLRPVVRRATPDDLRIAELNRKREKEALGICRELIEKHKLEMKLVDVECSFEGNKILFFFTADGRVDFRELVKDLAGVFRTRIELRQIGVRDKAKMVGGLGVCGRPFCCKEFLDDFQPVSIKMAKTQNLSLNPTKISGTCGRLMCCLKYEQEAYEDLLKTAPKNESFVDTPDGRGTVTEVNLLRQCVKVRMEDSPETVGCYKNCDICVLRSGKARKNDLPIPKDLAPISSKPRKVQPKQDEFEPLPEVIYPDQVSEFDQQSAFGAQNELLNGREISLTPGEADKPEAGDKPAGQNRRRRRRGRGKNPDGTPVEAKPQGDKAPEKPAEPRRDKRPNEQKPRPPRQNPERKPQGEKPSRSRRSRRRGPDSLFLHMHCVLSFPRPLRRSPVRGCSVPPPRTRRPLHRPLHGCVQQREIFARKSEKARHFHWKWRLIKPYSAFKSAICSSPICSHANCAQSAAKAYR